ncbi:MAG TPA: ABC transporter substrate-binding protein [Gammaproteobacteria bacterium]|nr:ABC transporter substrate-binding protein [Gammaproteobacteria bacterium]
MNVKQASDISHSLRRFMSGWVALLALSASLACGPTAAQAKVTPPQQMVEDTTHELLQRFQKDRTELKTHPDRLYDLVNDIVVPHFDFVRMSHWVLGRAAWSQMSHEQKTRFVLAFRTLLVRTYATALLQYQDQKINFLPLRGDPSSGHVEVRSTVAQPGGQSVAINYSLHQRHGQWLVYDVNVDGISLLSNYRSSFSDEINKTGINQLIARLEQRVQDKSSPDKSSQDKQSQ